MEVSEETEKVLDEEQLEVSKETEKTLRVEEINKAEDQEELAEGTGNEGN